MRTGTLGQNLDVPASAMAAWGGARSTYAGPAGAGHYGGPRTLVRLQPDTTYERSYRRNVTRAYTLRSISTLENVQCSRTIGRRIFKPHG
jgi:hypothetical protein